MCFLSNNIYDYFNVSQGKITIPGVDDGEECMLADVSRRNLCFAFRRILSFVYITFSIETLDHPLKKVYFT